jgi:hypothetical protein
MATSTTFLVGTTQNLLTTELNSLANNALAIGSAFTSSNVNYILAEIEFAGTFAANPTANTGVSVWFLRAIDGTNYEDGSGSVTPGRPPDITLQVTAGQAATRCTRQCVIPPGTWKPLLKNEGTGQALTASGHTLKILPRTFQQG